MCILMSTLEPGSNFKVALLCAIPKLLLLRTIGPTEEEEDKRTA
jgi:hypothetical protein